MPNALRWGIASAGKISNDFCIALSTLPYDEHKIIAVAAREKKRAEEFAQKHEISKFFGTYAELAECEEVDIVYIGCLNPQHFEISMLMLENGKHVLCEKPLCMNLKQAKKVIQYAEMKKLFLMEGIWSRFFPAYQYLRKQIDSGVLGEIQEVDVEFGFPLSEVDRLQKRELGGGTCLDLGIYAIQVSQWAFQEPPQEVKAKGSLNAEGVDVEVEAELHYTGKRMSKMNFSAKGFLGNNAVIKGSKGQITLKQFWCPTKIIDIDGQEKEWVLPKAKYPTNYVNSEGFRYEAESARQCIIHGEMQHEHVSHNDSLLFAQIADDIRSQVGVIYAEDIE